MSDIPNLQSLDLGANEIAELELGVVSHLCDLPNLERLEIWDNPIGCVSGIITDKVIYIERDDTNDASFWLDLRVQGFCWSGPIYCQTPICPENCTINTYYDPDNDVCLSCPENTYTKGIGAVNCTAVSVMATTTTTPILTTTTSATTTTPVPLCDGATSPFMIAGDTLCVPNNLYPAPNVSHCVFEQTWEDVKENWLK